MSQKLNLRKLALSMAMFAIFVIGSVATARADSCTIGGTELTGSGSGTLGGVLTITTVEIAGTGTQFTIALTGQTGSFVSDIAFNVTGSVTTTGQQTVANGGILCTNCGMIDSSGLSVTLGNNNQVLSPFTGFDGSIALPPPPGSDSAKLSAGESITFTVVGLFNVDLCDAFSTGSPSLSVVAHIQGLGTNNANSGKYTCTNCDGIGPPQAVPEPASMLLLGTGLVGVAGAARRRFKGRS